jgi:hypothetical protein
MATTPTRSLKRTLASTVEDRTPRFLLGSLVLAMVISLLAGLGIGIKVEQHRIKTKKSVAAVVKPKRPAKPGTVRAALLANVPVEGTVFSLGPKRLVVSGPRGRARLVMAPKTRIEVVRPGTAADIVVGSHVLFVLVKKTTTTTAAAAGATGSSSSGATSAPATATAAAKEIVVVSANGQKGRLGSVVTAVTSDSMTIKGSRGKVVTISTVGAKIEKTARGTRSSLVKGTRVIVRTYQGRAVRRKVKGKKARLVKPPRAAVEIVVLPSGTAFA